MKYIAINYYLLSYFKRKYYYIKFNLMNILILNKNNFLQYDIF